MVERNDGDGLAMVSIEHLGPYEVEDVTDNMINMVRINDAPIIIQQRLGDGTRNYAVLATKQVKIACIGCFKRDMLITDCTRVKKCSSFVKHWDTKKGLRCQTCKGDGDFMDVDPASCKLVCVNPAPKVDKATVLHDLTDIELLDAVKARKLEGDVAEEMRDEEFAAVARKRDMEVMVDARPTRLLHELHRQKVGASIAAYYHEEKQERVPHSSDPVGASLTVQVPVTGRGTRSKKRAKTEDTSFIFEPRTITDYR